MGASIGVSGNNHLVETLGGNVELYIAMGGKRTCALKCHHVVCPPQGIEIDLTARFLWVTQLRNPSMIRSILIELNKLRFKETQVLHSPSLLNHQTSVGTDKVRLKIEAIKSRTNQEYRDAWVTSSHKTANAV